MRPASIIRFEQLYWLWLVLSIVSVTISWAAVTTDPNMAQVLTRMPWFPYLVIAVVLALLVWLGLLISRRGSNIARWVFVILAALSVVQVAASIVGGAFVSNAANWIGVAAAVVAVAAALVTFRNDTAPWFRPVAADPA